MIYAGIDYSLLHPAITYYNDQYPFDFKYMTTYVVVNKIFDHWPEHIIQIPAPEWSHEIDRYTRLAECIACQPADYFFIENYSYGSVGRLFSIAENVAVLKYRIYFTWNASYIMLVPTQVKKFATGKGNAKKDLMFEAFQQEYPDYFSQQEKLKGKSPISDIIDSYYILKLGVSLKTTPTTLL